MAKATKKAAAERCEQIKAVATDLALNGIGHLAEHFEAAELAQYCLDVAVALHDADPDAVDEDEDEDYDDEDDED